MQVCVPKTHVLSLVSPNCFGIFCYHLYIFHQSHSLLICFKFHPLTAHHLMPGDIDIVGAMGDSITVNIDWSICII